MRMRNLFLSAGSLTLVVAGAIHAFQEDGEMAAAMAAAAPADAHKLLARFAGDWDAELTMSMPGMTEPMVGKEVNKIAHGGLWLVGDFTMDNMMGMPFSGHNVVGWDSEKEKYVAIWVDSMSQRIAMQEGDYDEATKTLTMWNDGRDPMTGEPVREKHIQTLVDENTRTFSMQSPGPEGEFVETMKITYKRKR